MASPDWLQIEGEYRANSRALRAIAADHGISEGAIRKKAKKLGWSRDPAGTMRERVKAHFAGASTQTAPEYAARVLDEIATQTINHLELAERNAVRILQHVDIYLSRPNPIEPKDLKTLNDANAGALDTIRRIRSLDAPAEQIFDKAHRDAIVAAAALDA